MFYLLFVVCFCVIQSSAINAGESFNQDQTKKIQQIIHDYIVNNPNILVEAGKKLQEQEAAKEKARVEKIKNNVERYKKEIFDTKSAGRIVTGNPAGRLIIAEFTQYQCPSCKATTSIVDKLLKDNPDVQRITIYWPFFGNDSVYAAKVALAAKKQNKFNELNQAMISATDFLTKNKVDDIVKLVSGIDIKKLNTDASTKEFDDGLKANIKLASDLNLVGTPTFIFTNKEMTKFGLVLGQTRDVENDLKKSLNEVR